MLTVAVKVGNKSTLRIRNAEVSRVITIQELEHRLGNNCDVLIIEDINEIEYRSAMDVLQRFVIGREKPYTCVFSPNNDETTTGLADALELDIFDNEESLYITIESAFGVYTGSKKWDNEQADTDSNNTGFYETNSQDSSDEGQKEECKDIEDGEKGVEETLGESSEEGNKGQAEEVELVENEPKEIEGESEGEETELIEIEIKEDEVVADQEPDVRSGTEANVGVVLDERDKKIEALTDALKCYKKKFESLGELPIVVNPTTLEEYKKLKSEVDTLRNKVKGLCDTIDNKNGIEESLKRQKESLENQIAQLEAKLDGLESGQSELQERQSEIQSLQGSLRTANEEVERLQREFNEARDEAYDLRTKLNEKESRVTELEGSNEGLKNDIKYAKEKIAQLESDYVDIVNAERQASEERDAHRTRAEELEEEIGKLKSQMEQSESSHAEAIGELDSQITDLRTRLNGQEDQISEQVSEINAKEAEIERQRGEIASQKEEADRHRSEISRQQEEIDKQQDAIAEYQRRLDEAKNAEKRIAEIARAKDEADDRAKKDREQLESIRRAYKEAENKVDELTQALEDAKKEYEEMSLTTKSSEAGIKKIAYKGKAGIIPVFGNGSFGITTTAYSIAGMLAQQSKVLYVDFDILTAKADTWFKRSPVIKGVAGTSGLGNKCTGLGIAFTKGANFVKANVNQLIQTIVKTKNGQLSYLSGAYYSISESELFRCDFGTLVEALCEGFQYVVIDFGRFGVNDAQTSVIREFCRIAIGIVNVSTNDKFDIRNNKMAMQDIKLIPAESQKKLKWVLNMAESTKIEEDSINMIRPNSFVQIQFIPELFGKKKGFMKDAVARDKLRAFLTKDIIVKG